jgi:CDP-glucose 4,6-dehydratase
MSTSGCPDPAFWAGRSVFLTGHTGFVGGWLASWLVRLGARVHGYSLPPVSRPNLFECIGLGSRTQTTFGDIRDQPQLVRTMAEAEPELVFHLAAQPLVGKAFADPFGTIATNVAGTANVLAAAQEMPSLKGMIVFTTDKVYAEVDRATGHREDDFLGGREPYALSKASAEFIVAAYRSSNLPRLRSAFGLATVRAGNLIGGGDWAERRIVPDAIRAFAAGKPLELRKPAAIRPWQHVLEAVRGLLILAESACQKPAIAAGAWNFGPAEVPAHTVADVADLLVRHWADGASWLAHEDASVPESDRLEIDSRKAAEKLGWRTAWPIETAIAETVDWYRAFYRGRDMISATSEQLGRYIDLVTVGTAKI